MATSNAAPAAMPVRPKLVVFDLDACVWIPEMYQVSRPVAFIKLGGHA